MFCNIVFLLIFESHNQKRNKMKNSTHRDFILEISEIDETRNPFEIALKLMNALRVRSITFDQFQNLWKELKFECQRNGISAKNDVCSLF